MASIRQVARLSLLSCAAIAAAAVAASEPGNPSASNVPVPVRSYLLGEHGVVELRLTADDAGKAKDVRVEASSGYDRLDAAALRTAMSLSIDAGDLPEAMRGGRASAPVTIAYPKRAHGMSDERVNTLLRMTCAEAMAEYDLQVGGATGSAKVLVPPFGDVLPAMSPAVEMYRDLVETPADQIDDSLRIQLLAMDVVLGPMPYYVDDVRRKCADRPEASFLDVTFPQDVETTHGPAPADRGNAD